MTAMDAVMVKYKAGISPIMEAVLAFLENEPSEIMKILNFFYDKKICSQATVHANLHAAIGQKLVISYHDKKNRRKKLVKLTEKGRLHLGKVRKTWAS